MAQPGGINESAMIWITYAGDRDSLLATVIYYHQSTDAPINNIDYYLFISYFYNTFPSSLYYSNLIEQKLLFTFPF